VDVGLVAESLDYTQTNHDIWKLWFSKNEWQQPVAHTQPMRPPDTLPHRIALLCEIESSGIFLEDAPNLLV
jgi:hypothetical protein